MSTQDANHEHRKPDETFRAGKISAKIWVKAKPSDHGGTYPEFSIKIVKSFNDGQDWRETCYYFPDELPSLRYVVERAFSYCIDVSNAWDRGGEFSS